MSDKNEAYLKTELEYVMDLTDPRDVSFRIKSQAHDMSDRDVYDALVYLTHKVLGPRVLGSKAAADKDARECLDIKSH